MRDSFLLLSNFSLPKNMTKLPDDEIEVDDFLDDEDEEEARKLTPTEMLVFEEPVVEEVLPEGHKSGYVALVGRPNVGKSTLLNGMLKQKIAIVSHRPQTTRTKQLGIVTEADHQIIFVDTPGIMQKAMHKLDELMLDAATETLKDADLVIWLVDGTVIPNEEDARLAEMMVAAGGKTLLVINKNDEILVDDVVERTNHYRSFLPADTDWFFISAKKQRGTEELYQKILDELPEGPRYFPADQITQTFTRDIVADLIREQILLNVRDEIPHGTTVLIDTFNEEGKSIQIKANIFVERESHKAIIIGAGGKMLKRIGSEGRKEIEDLLHQNIFLELWVKVAPKWRKREGQLKRFGYIEK
ncbi:MAG: GTP-binding protein Era [Cellvibrionaceae bacterium]|jgi:GTP-binding protein Era